MPVIKSAKKKLKQDKKRAVKNSQLKTLFKKTVKDVEKAPSEEKIREAFKIIDKTAKSNIIHRNKAARVKSKISKLSASGKTSSKPVKKAVKTSPKSKK